VVDVAIATPTFDSRLMSPGIAMPAGDSESLV
jgi:hypothetical protein